MDAPATAEYDDVQQEADLIAGHGVLPDNGARLTASTIDECLPRSGDRPSGHPGIVRRAAIRGAAQAYTEAALPLCLSVCQRAHQSALASADIACSVIRASSNPSLGSDTLEMKARQPSRMVLNQTVITHP